MTSPRSMYLVDDSVDYRFLVQQVFTMFLPHCPVRFFADGADLVEAFDSLAGEVQPKVIILDVDMPRLNGFQTLVQLKQHPCWQSVSVVMMTNRTRQDYEKESFRLGASAFVPKPMDLIAIKSVMTQLNEHPAILRRCPGCISTLFRLGYQPYLITDPVPVWWENPRRWPRECLACADILSPHNLHTTYRNWGHQSTGSNRCRWGRG